MTIIVTQTDIEKAQELRNKSPEDTQACPIFNACKRYFKNRLVGVSMRYIWLRNGTSYLLPKQAVDFIMAFDKNKLVKPFKFEAEAK
jgi:hypothetical protein